MNYRLLFSLLVALTTITSAAQHSFTGGSPLATGQTGLLSSDIWAMEYNQAGIANITSFSGAVSYNSPFLLSELGVGQAFVTMPVGEGTFGLSLQSRGFSLYQEGFYGLAYGRKLSEDFRIGVQINYYTLQLGEGYGSTSAVTVEAGVAYDLNENLSLAAHISNPNQSSFGDDETLPAILRGGVQYSFSPQVIFNAEIWKSVDEDAQLRFGVKYQPNELLELSIGTSTNPGSLYAGFGLNWPMFSANIATAYHSVLGYTPQISLVYHGKQ